MRNYENLQYLQENRLKQRAFYIPEGNGTMISLNGIWNFEYYERDYDSKPADPLRRCLPGLLGNHT